MKWEQRGESNLSICSPYCFTSTEFHRQKILQKSCNKYYTNVKIKLYKCLKVDEVRTEKHVKSVNPLSVLFRINQMKWEQRGESNLSICSPYCFTSTEFHRQKILQNSCTKSKKYYINVKKNYTNVLEMSQSRWSESNLSIRSPYFFA